MCNCAAGAFEDQEAADGHQSQVSQVHYRHTVYCHGSQFAALLLTTRPSAVVNLFNTGELAVSFVHY